ncbi:MAG TPA: hypothetical protein VKS81_00600 [Bacteroidota bacterium]|nr:hypothetical protein [Bacteroidota bacterium]
MTSYENHVIPALKESVIASVRHGGLALALPAGAGDATRLPAVFLEGGNLTVVSFALLAPPLNPLFHKEGKQFTHERLYQRHPA